MDYNSSFSIDHSIKHSSFHELEKKKEKKRKTKSIYEHIYIWQREDGLTCIESRALFSPSTALLAATERATERFIPGINGFFAEDTAANKLSCNSTNTRGGGVANGTIYYATLSDLVGETSARSRGKERGIHSQSIQV